VSRHARAKRCLALFCPAVTKSKVRYRSVTPAPAIDHRTRLVLGVVELHLKHLKLVFRAMPASSAALDRFVMRFEMTVHHSE